MTPKTSIGRGNTPHFYYQCTKNVHSSGTDCDAKYVPAEAAEEYVLGELRQMALSPQEIERVVRDANAQKDDSLGHLVEEEKGLRLRIREVGGKIASIVDAVESGTNFRSLQERLGELESERTSVEEALARVEGEMAYIRQNALSVEVMAESFRDLPAVLDRLAQARDWHGVKEVVGRHVEVVDWHQDADDPTTGSVDIMVFEEAVAGREVGAEKRSTPRALTSGASSVSVSSPSRTRTYNKPVNSRNATSRKSLPDNSSGDEQSRFARGFAQPSTFPPQGSDPHLVRVVEAWPSLSEPIRRAVLALIESATL